MYVLEVITYVIILRKKTESLSILNRTFHIITPNPKILPLFLHSIVLALPPL